jgi:hypothetical protein
MMRANGVVKACLVILCLLYPLSNSFAEGLRVGSLGIYPFISGSIGHTDNLFLTETDEESDTFFVLSPGIRLILPRERYAFNFDYTLDHYTYNDRDNADRTIHNATAVLDLNPWRRLDIEIKDAFTRGEELPNFREGRTSKYIWNSPSIDAAYDITSRLALGAGYAYATKTYDRSVDQIDDYDDNALSGRLFFRILPKTSLVLVYQYLDREYDQRGVDDNESNLLEGGVTWEFGDKSTGTVRAGYMSTDYDRLSRTDETFTYYINVIHQLRPKTTLTVEGVRAILDTSRSDENLLFSNDYVSTQIAGILAHRYRKFTGKLRVAYINDDYLHADVGTRKRKDDLLRVEVGLDHALRKWLKLGGSYRYTNLNSNFEAEEYTENAFLFYLSLIL